MDTAMKSVRCPKCQTDTPHQFLDTARLDPEGWLITPMRCAICATEIQSLEPPDVFYLFAGGPLDGQTLSGQTAQDCFLESEEVEIGLTFTPPNCAAHYEITEKDVHGGKVHLVAKFIAEP
jgi:hypothetical protein